MTKNTPARMKAARPSNCSRLMSHVPCSGRGYILSGSHADGIRFMPFAEVYVSVLSYYMARSRSRFVGDVGPSQISIRNRLSGSRIRRDRLPYQQAPLEGYQAV